MKEPAIEQIWMERKKLPLRMPFAISKGTLESSDNVFFFVKDSSQLMGLGESAPFPVLTGDTAQIVEDIGNVILRSFLGLTVDQGLREILQTLRKEYWTQSPTILTGIEMALLDLRAKQMGISLSRAFGTSNLAQLRSDITLPIMPTSQVPEFWGHFSSHEFLEIKVKVGGHGVSEDADRVEHVSSLAPKGTKVSLDGNQGCTVESSLELLKTLAMRGIHPTLFEQPLNEKAFEGMAELSRKTETPICADELVKTKEDAIRAVLASSCKMINLKFMKLGIHEAIMIAGVAKSAGLGLMIGGMVETEVAMSSSLHFACGSGLIDWLDLDTPFFFGEAVTDDSPWHRGKASLICPNGPGLGIQWKK
jgi:L-alanine-DL-glutamate epimerase-like enolase superfamily enzyme